MMSGRRRFIFFGGAGASVAISRVTVPSPAASSSVKGDARNFGPSKRWSVESIKELKQEIERLKGWSVKELGPNAARSGHWSVLLKSFAAVKQSIVTLDMEGVLTPEIWIAVAEKTGIADLRRTTRDEPDYDKLMCNRL